MLHSYRECLMDSPGRASVRDCYYAGDLVIDVGRQTVNRAGLDIPLPRLSFEVLVALVEAHPRMLSIEELMESVWAPAVVNAETVSQRILLLRHSLGDHSASPRYIVGVRGRGYRFDAPVSKELLPASQAVMRVTQESGDPDKPQAAPTVSSRLSEAPRSWLHRLRPRYRLIGSSVAILGSLILAIVTVLWLAGRTGRDHAGKEAEPPEADPIASELAVASSQTSIAVLPFVDMSEKHDQEYFADGMAEDLLDVLVRIPGLRVIGRTSSFQFKGRNEDARSIGTKLGVANIVEGSIRKVGTRVRVTAQLIDARSGAQLWGDSYNRDFGDVLVLQDQIAAGIGRALSLAVGNSERRSPRQLHSTEAYTLYLRGQLAYDRGPAGWREAQSNFEQALALDPTSIRVAEGLVRAYGAEVTDSYVPSNIGWQKTAAAINKALRIDPDSAIAHIYLGYMHGVYEYDWLAANAELKKATAAHSPDPVAQNAIAWMAFDLGHRDEALRLIDAALVTDPLNPDTITNKGMSLYDMGDLDGAERAFRKCLEVSPTYTETYLYLGEIQLSRGQYKAALTETMRATPNDGRDIGLAMIYHALGRKRDSDAALARVISNYGDLWPHDVAQVYAYRGDLDESFKWLEKAYAERRYGLILVRDDPLFARVRGDPRYRVLLHKMNLPE